MVIKLKKYKFEKIEIDSIDFNLPNETEYYFETHIRRSIKIKPIYTTWQKERFNKEEEIWKFEITCIYLSFKCKAEKFTITVGDLDDPMLEKRTDVNSEFIKSWLGNNFDKRSKEQYESDLTQFLSELND